MYERSLFHYETDSDGVCHFSNYYRIAEEAFFKMIADGSEHRFAVANSSAEYSKPLRYGSRFQVALELTEMRRSNFTLKFSITENGSTAAEVSLRFVALHAENWEVIPLTQTLRERLKIYDTNIAASHL